MIVKLTCQCVTIGLTCLLPSLPLLSPLITFRVGSTPTAAADEMERGVSAGDAAAVEHRGNEGREVDLPSNVAVKVEAKKLNEQYFRRGSMSFLSVRSRVQISCPPPFTKLEPKYNVCLHLGLFEGRS